MAAAGRKHWKAVTSSLDALLAEPAKLNSSVITKSCSDKVNTLELLVTVNRGHPLSQAAWQKLIQEQVS